MLSVGSAGPPPLARVALSWSPAARSPPNIDCRTLAGRQTSVGGGSAVPTRRLVHIELYHIACVPAMADTTQSVFRNGRLTFAKKCSELYDTSTVHVLATKKI